jgi:DNA-binding MarR family transcriptional regulator
MTSPLDVADIKPQYTAGFLANSFGLTLKQAREILDLADSDRDTAAELARRLRYTQP